MALYNVESPGGYQLTGRTIPGVDILGSKRGYSLSRPWLFEDFDQLSFHEVSEQEYEKQLAVFHSGRYEYEVEDTEFDMEEHNRLLRDTKEEVVEIRKRQSEAQARMDEVEREMMDRWTKEKAEGKVPMDKVEALLNGKPLLSLARFLVCFMVDVMIWTVSRSYRSRWAYQSEGTQGQSVNPSKQAVMTLLPSHV